MKIFKKNHFIFLVIALCRFCHRKLDISKTVTARGFNLGQLIKGVWGGERSGLVVECLTRDRGAAGSSHTGVCVVSLSKNINPSLVLVQPRKTRPFITERLLMGRKE